MQKRIDGHKVIFKSTSNTPSVPFIKKTFSGLPTGRLPIVFETKTQYLNEYIKNQERKKHTTFTPAEKNAYKQRELNDMKNIVSRYTTRHNPYIDPRIVFFTDKRLTKPQFQKSAEHEAGHVLWERNPKLRRDWKPTTPPPTQYGRTDKQEDFAESFMLKKSGQLQDPARNRIIQKDVSKNSVSDALGYNYPDEIESSSAFKFFGAPKMYDPIIEGNPNLRGNVIAVTRLSNQEPVSTPIVEDKLIEFHQKNTGEVPPLHTGANVLALTKLTLGSIRPDVAVSRRVPAPSPSPLNWFLKKKINLNHDWTSQDKKVNLYHGTATQFVPDILQEGLKRGHETLAPSLSKDVVFVTTSPQSASFFGGMHGTPAILKVRVPEENLRIANQYGKIRSSASTTNLPAFGRMKGAAPPSSYLGVEADIPPEDVTVLSKPEAARKVEKEFRKSDWDKPSRELTEKFFAEEGFRKLTKDDASEDKIAFGLKDSVDVSKFGFDEERSVSHGTSLEKARAIKTSGKLTGGTFPNPGRGGFEDSSTWARNVYGDKGVVILAETDKPLRKDSFGAGWVTLGERAKERRQDETYPELNVTKLKTFKINVPPEKEKGGFRGKGTWAGYELGLEEIEKDDVSLPLEDTRKYKFGSIDWQESMMRNINEKQRKGDVLNKFETGLLEHEKAKGNLGKTTITAGKIDGKPFIDIDTDEESKDMPIVKDTTIPAVEYPGEFKSYTQVIKRETTPAEAEALIRKTWSGKMNREPSIQEVAGETRTAKIVDALNKGRAVPPPVIYYTKKGERAVPTGYDNAESVAAAQELKHATIPIVHVLERGYKPGPGLFKGEFEYTPEEKSEMLREEQDTMKHGLTITSTPYGGEIKSADGEEITPARKSTMLIDTIPGKFEKTSGMKWHWETDTEE